MSPQLLIRRSPYPWPGSCDISPHLLVLVAAGRSSTFQHGMGFRKILQSASSTRPRGSDLLRDRQGTACGETNNDADHPVRNRFMSTFLKNQPPTPSSKRGSSAHYSGSISRDTQKPISCATWRLKLFHQKLNNSRDEKHNPTQHRNLVFGPTNL